MGPRLYKTASALPKGTRRVDALTGAMNELFFIDHPAVSKKHPQAPERLATFLKKTKAKSVWAYYPWRRTAVRIPDESTYYRLRTARNRDLIPEEEQRSYRACAVGIAGLSVGSAALASLVATGGPVRLKIADPDTIEITNLNRIRATLLDVAQNKAVVAARSAWELDPFARIELWDRGIRADTLARFIKGLDIFVDEMDDIGMKVACREACKKARVPVLMATDNGDSVIVDVERYDLEPRRPLFHGRVTLPAGNLSDLSREAFVALANQIIDPALFTDRQRDSIAAIGTRLSGVAQIATAASLSGAAIAFAVRRIGAGLPMPSGRYEMGCEESLIPGYTSLKARRARQEHARAFMRGPNAPPKKAPRRSRGA